MRHLRILVGVIAALISPGCSAVEPKMKLDQAIPVAVLKSNLHAVQSKRSFKEVGFLTKDEIGQLISLIEKSKPKKMGFVTSKFFLKSGKMIAGIVINSSGEYVGIDVTQEDVSGLPATATHTILVPLNQNDANGMLKLLQRFKDF
jgi:hypothetical protein